MTTKPENLIPQRYPFEFIDKFVRVEAGVEASAIKLISINEWFFSQDNPNNLIVPRPFVIEMMAQTGVGAILSLHEGENLNVFFGGIRNAMFFKDIVPGDVLNITVKMKKIKGKVGLGSGIVLRNEVVICKADLIFIIEG
ncbi:3-hydroxyacyl-ACP dehydratase FabZ family protein [Companilactobacillus nuruki]|uniref:Beta-hydroxyacyl-ACP dehydratase n=1 Tax=Companilactobacillus nuruki TaxID=1993540 RepID=A0A2N7AWB6_9LACO|nr:3-hydroxyacyl-ACP dehydratase FabZ family protein [Companilactobacillus nuruki]PMD73032.1 beta-hydroxyacyl-ACP dehydratase [Companilactobacillus nuruki]